MMPIPPCLRCRIPFYPASCDSRRVLAQCLKGYSGDGLSCSLLLSHPKEITKSIDFLDESPIERQRRLDREKEAKKKGQEAKKEDNKDSVDSQTTNTSSQGSSAIQQLRQWQSMVKHGNDNPFLLEWTHIKMGVKIGMLLGLVWLHGFFKGQRRNARASEHRDISYRDRTV
eukprot:g60796.t1